MGSTKKCEDKTNNSVTDNIQPGDSFSGYTVTRIDRLESIDASLIQLEHRITRTRHFHIACQDKENTFSVIFRTVPEDSTGVAHILEHMVLCGSLKYQVRDPFFSMLKRSLSTFMNAFTASDWTMYPFSTQNRKDYFNLMDVYLDAVFFPRLEQTSFKQEGHRIEPVEPDHRDLETQPVELEYKGVVYNEMKGAMSSPSQVMGRSLLKALYPDTTYSNNSGGEPSVIPQLTHEGLKAFHARYYHPSNAFFYTYGSFDLEDTLEFINSKVLSRFEHLAVDSAVPPQPRWDAPRTAEQAYAFSDAEPPDKKYQACVAWLTCDVKNDFEVLVLTVLEQILLGNAASPLRKALIDSGLGTALSDASGFDPDNRDTMFVTGLKDITKDAAGQVESLIFSTLEKLVEEKIPRELIDSAIHQIEFYRKEITNTPHPFGIKLVLAITPALIHDADPVACINIDHDLAKLQQAISSGPFLETKIKEYFLDNPHRVMFTLYPDQALEGKELNRVKAELEAIRSTLSEADLEKLAADAKELAAIQEAEEDPSVLPTLAISDIPPEVQVIQPTPMDNLKQITPYEKPTSGILYFTCPSGLQGVSQAMLPLIPFFCKAFTNAGTQNRSYEEVAKLMDLYTGGILISPFSGSFYRNADHAHAFLSIQGKALDRNADPMFDLIKEFIKHYSFKDHERLKQLLFQYKASLESSIVASGHIYAITMASRHISPATHINELWHGISQYRFIRKLTEAMEDPQSLAQALTSLSEDLSRISESVCIRDNFKAAAIGSADSIKKADRHFNTINDDLAGIGSLTFTLPALDDRPGISHDGWHTNTAVSFVAQAFKTVRMPHPDAPALAIISKLLRSLYLHREIREKGGAYGGFASYNYDEGFFSFGSYRDPHITRTLDVYRNACVYVMDGSYTDNDIKEAILQVCSDIDKPETPGPASIKAFYRSITGLTDQMRLDFKSRLLTLDKQQIVETARTYFDIEDSMKGTAVISGKESLEQANRQIEEKGQAPLSLHSI